MIDVAIIGAGMAGMATAARLQKQGFSTMVFEAHGRPGGCAGFFRRRGFAFDVGATTLVDFEPGGVGGELLDAVGMPPIEGEALPGYVAWLPDRTVTLYRDSAIWHSERLQKLGVTPQHQRLWVFLDQLADVFWNASREGVKLPLRSPVELWNAAQILGLKNAPLARYLSWTMGDALSFYGLREDKPLVSLLSMLIEDTVHSTIDNAPLINAALGITIRGAGLSRHNGGMYGFWQRFVEYYRAMGGLLRVGCSVYDVQGEQGNFILNTQRGTFEARQVVSAIPAQAIAHIAPQPVRKALRPYLQRDEESLGGAIVMFLGVPESEIMGQEFTHHQLLQDYDAPLGNGNNMFISVSAHGDTLSAPAGYRAVMISTHCNLAEWENLNEDAYQAKKVAVGEALLTYAWRVYPNLGRKPVVFEIGTPSTYEKFTHRPRGAVGGVRQNLRNSNQFAIPHQLGMRGFWLVGDTTWPGLGTVACTLGSRIVAEGVIREARQKTIPLILRRPRVSSSIYGGGGLQSRRGTYLPGK